MRGQTSLSKELRHGMDQNFKGNRLSCTQKPKDTRVNLESKQTKTLKAIYQVKRGHAHTRNDKSISDIGLAI